MSRRPVFGVGRADPDARARGAALRTPSPTFSDASATSSHGPSTPPPVHRTLLFPSAARATVAAAATRTTAMTIDESLASRPDGRMPIAWSVHDHPSRATLAPGARRSLNALLSKPATQPPTQHLMLVSELLPFPIQVNLGAAAGAAAPRAPRVRALSLPDEDEVDARAPREPYVAVEDVLAAIYMALQIPLSGTEINGLTTERRRGLLAAFDSRLETIHDARHHQFELVTGPRWVDLVAASGRTRFLGLSATKRGPNVLSVHFG